MAHWARLYLASSQFFRQHLDAAIAALERLGADAPLERYPSLEGRLRWLLGGMDILRSRPGEALADLRRALELLEAAGEVEGSVGVHYATAMVLGTLGDTEDAWRHLYAALVLLPRLQSPVRATACLQEAGIAALQLGELEAALDIQDELVLRSLALGEAETVAVAKLRRAETLARLGRHPEARQELAAARAHAAQIAAPSLRARLEVEISLAQAEEELGIAPAAAARRATEAIAFFEESDFQFYLPLAHVLRARARFAAGDERGALADYFASLDQIESTRRNALDPQLQITFFDQSNALFDQTLAVLAQPGRDADASFAVVERGRARDLLDRLSSGSDRPPATEPRLSLHALQQQLPAGTLLVRYALLPDRLLIWWLTRDDKGFVRVSKPASVVEAQVDAAARALQAHRSKRRSRRCDGSIARCSGRSRRP